MSGFGLVMSARDAQGALEDVTMVRAAFSRVGSAEEVEHQRQLALSEQRTREFEQKNDVIRTLKKQLFESVERGQEVSIASRSAKQTIDMLIEEIAALRGQAPQQVRQRVNAIRTQNYEKLVEGSLKSGELHSDPRTNGTAHKRDWYRPDLL